MIPEWRRYLQWTPGTPVLWEGKPWPIRTVFKYDARVGDIFAGNVDWVCRCDDCGWCAAVDPAVLAPLYEPLTHVRDLPDLFRCSRCGNKAIPQLACPRAPELGFQGPYHRAGGTPTDAAPSLYPADDLGQTKTAEVDQAAGAGTVGGGKPA